MDINLGHRLKALVRAFSMITSLRVDLRLKLYPPSHHPPSCRHCQIKLRSLIWSLLTRSQLSRRREFLQSPVVDNGHGVYSPDFSAQVQSVLSRSGPGTTQNIVNQQFYLLPQFSWAFSSKIIDHMCLKHSSKHLQILCQPEHWVSTNWADC